MDRERNDSDKVLDTDTIVGCSTCPFGTFRFNGGNGAMTCEKLRNRIVRYGHHHTERALTCPLPVRKINQETPNA